MTLCPRDSLDLGWAVVYPYLSSPSFSFSKYQGDICGVPPHPSLYSLASSLGARTITNTRQTTTKPYTNTPPPLTKISSTSSTVPCTTASDLKSSHPSTSALPSFCPSFAPFSFSSSHDVKHPPKPRQRNTGRRKSSGGAANSAGVAHKNDADLLRARIGEKLNKRHQAVERETHTYHLLGCNLVIGVSLDVALRNNRLTE